LAVAVLAACPNTISVTSNAQRRMRFIVDVLLDGSNRGQPA
jgi:hypothetical protein